MTGSGVLNASRTRVMAARPFVVPLARAPHASGGFSDLLAQGERRHVVLSIISPKYLKKVLISTWQKCLGFIFLH